MVKEAIAVKSTQELRVFICYSRTDLAFVDRLDLTLRPRGITLYIDRNDIAAFEDWRDRVTDLIASSDVILVVLSPDALVSEHCRNEIEIAARLNKRFAPIVARDVGNSPVPGPVERINYIFFRERDDFAAAADKLVEALLSDLDWIREHTRYGVLARRWDASGRPADQLLRGAEIARALSWVGRPAQYTAPEPTELHKSFIDAAVEQQEKQRRAEWENVSAFQEKIRLHIKAAEFHQALDELNQAIGYFAQVTDDELLARRGSFEKRRQRIDRVVRFLDGARAVYVFAGQEEFERARETCEETLTTIGALDNDQWWLHLPSEDLEQREIDRIKYETHRQLLLLSGMRLQPGIDKITPKTKPSFDVTKLLRFVPGFVMRAAVRAGVLDFLPALRKCDNPAAAADFRLSLATLEKARAFEAAHAAERSEAFPPSRTSALVAQMGGLLLAYSSGPKGEKIDVRALLERGRSSARSSPADALNPADYYFLGLFNFFVAKRRDAAVNKIFSLFQGVFPDLDLDTPYDTAERLLRTGVSREPENFWPHFVLGRTLLGRGDFKGAELAFNVCISVDPNYARGYEQRALALAEQWRVTRYDEVLRRAQDDSRRALELAGDDPSTFWPRGEMLHTLGLDREALDAFSKWMQLEEDILAKLSRSTGVQKAHDLAQALLKRRDGETVGALRAECFALLGFVYLLWGQLAEADDFVSRALALDANHVHARTVKGMLLCRQDQFAAGIVELDAAIRGHPTAYRARLSRAEAYEALADRQRALQAWAELANTSGHVPALPAWMRAAAASARARVG